ncbi:HlyD family type I secretion periplasmic adaptor subunit [Acetobacteraceae bacterium]|nr:HlyD family type I secretion periplasmic adaptor subunit [Acetobacteraceae bacterium]
MRKIMAMREGPESHWKTSRFERFIAFLLKPFSPLIRFILGVSEEERNARQAEKRRKKSLRAENKAEKIAEKALKKAQLQQGKAEKKSAETVKQAEEPEVASPELPEFFGPHPAQEQEEQKQEKTTDLEEEVISQLNKTEAALDAEIPLKGKGAGFFKTIVLYATAPIVFLRYGIGKIGGKSFFSHNLRKNIQEDGFFVGSVHYFSDLRKKSKKKAEEKANNPRYKDPLGAGDEPLELLEFRSPTVAIVNTPLPPLARYIIWVMLGLIASMLLAMVLLPINKVVVLKGRLISKRPMILVQPTDQGIVLDIKVRVGDVVKKGQLLGVMDPRLTQSELVAMREELKIYQALVARLKAEVADRPYVPDESDPASLEQGKNYLHRQKDFRAKLETIDETIASQQTTLQGAEASAAMYGSKLRIALELLRIRQAEQHHEVGTRLGTLQAQDAVMDTERQLIEAQKAANSARSELKGEQAKRESFLQSWKAEAYSLLAETEVKLATAQSSYDQAQVKNELVNLRAPEDGIVLSQGKIARGATLSAGMPFMTLVPLKGGIEMEGSMKAEDAGYVKTGAHAIIKFVSFPYDVYGGAEGSVSVISADSFLPMEAVSENTQEAVLPPDEKAALFYRVKVSLDRYTLHGTPKFFHPGPGQVVTADLDVGKRTMMQYFFGNVKTNLSEGMREPSN